MRYGQGALCEARWKHEAVIDAMQVRLRHFGLIMNHRNQMCHCRHYWHTSLSGLANHTAKRLQAQTGGVVNFADPAKRDWVLRNTGVAEV